MTCPRCEKALARETVVGTEVDRCPGCGGVWLDPGEGEAVTRPDEAGAVPTEVLAAAIEDHHRSVPVDPPVDCPRCGEAMAREVFERSGVEIDRCKCGVWLDTGEVEKIASYRTERLEEMAGRFEKASHARLERIYARAYFDLGT